MDDANRKKLWQHTEFMPFGDAGKISPHLEATRASVNAFMVKHGIVQSKGVSRDASVDSEPPKSVTDAAASSQPAQGTANRRKAKARRKKAAKRAAQDVNSSSTSSSSMSESTAPSLARVSGCPLRLQSWCAKGVFC